MTNYLRLEISESDQMQESDLLHLIQLNLDFSLETVKVFDQQHGRSFLLVNTLDQNYSLEKITQSKAYLNCSTAEKQNFILDVLYMITKNLSTIQNLLIKPDYELIKPEFVICYHNTYVLRTIKWLILPFGYKLNLQSDNIWHYIAAQDLDIKDQILSHYNLIRQGDYQAALNLLKKKNQNPDSEENNLQLSDLKFEQRIPKKEHKQKSISQKTTRNTKQMKTNNSQGQILTDTTNRFYKKENLLNKIKNKLKNSNRRNSIPSETTVPLNPQDDLFRLAMISEGPPGTITENEGLKAFILVDEFLIGRDNLVCDLILKEQTIGRIHARISRHGSHYFLQDLGSANGSWLDGKKLNKHQTYLLPDQCRLKFAELTFYFHIE